MSQAVKFSAALDLIQPLHTTVVRSSLMSDFKGWVLTSLKALIFYEASKYDPLVLPLINVSSKLV